MTQYVDGFVIPIPKKNVKAYPELAGAKPSETVVFAWIVYKNKAARNRVNANVCKDARLEAMMKGKKLPFDMRRMACGGFTTLVEASAQ